MSKDCEQEKKNLNNFINYLVNVTYNQYKSLNIIKEKNKYSYINHLTEENLHHKKFHLKLTACIIFICTYVMLNLVFLTQDFNIELSCFQDKGFILTEKYNKWFAKPENDLYLRILIIIGGLLMDVVIIGGLILIAIRGKSWRLAVSLFLLYGSRGFLQEIYSMSHHEEYLFKNPGIYSLTVPYFKTTDYFFSGHVSLPILLGIEFYKTGRKRLSIFCAITTVYEFIMMLLLRGHYSIDLYAALIFSCYYARIAETLCKPLDKYINIWVLPEEEADYRKNKNKSK